ncbi:ABC transporter permease [Hufsiella ginkgonis]|uniref:FtsX-like permease family protein n=1 Tax=Hufsiella ginkgonis TaxID=2695274 RepID=A0A7K1XV19_9SPHI|nr:ABC transporter permease [Hufsiella ginkgonis]MXV14855.1 FtsX-like permease family protein [Hufsiella ginkgonis]
MFKNYIKTSLRNLWKRKLFTSIHIIGLGVAFGAAILLFIVAANQLTFDDFHINKQTIHLLSLEQHRAQKTDFSDNMPVPMAPAVKRELSGVTAVTRVMGGMVASRQGSKELDLGINYVDPSFLQMFSFPLISGNTRLALSGPEQVVLTENASQKLFGTTATLGKPVQLNADGVWKTFVVSGILKDLPNNSSIRFDVLVRFENAGNYRSNADQWGNLNHNVFVQLREDMNPQRFEQSSHAFINKYFAEDINTLTRDGGKPGPDGQVISLRLISLPDMHFNKTTSIGNATSIVFPWLLIVLSIFILFIASTNFINLSLAGSFTRSREIGMRKTLGAGRAQILTQLWGEALITCLFALTLGGLLAQVLLGYFNAEMRSVLTFSVLFSPKVLAWFLVLFLAVTAFAGGYPAAVMSKFNTILTLKGGLKMNSKNKLRNVLISTQFVIAILLITSTFIISSQMRYLRSKPLGYNKTQVISIPVGTGPDGESVLKLMRAKLAAVPGVLAVSGTDNNLGRGKDGSSRTSVIGFDYHNREIKTHWQRVDYDYLETLDIPLLAGRDFSRDFDDSASVLINEKMAQQIGGKNQVGTLLPIGDGHNLVVIGVVKDFNFKSLHKDIEPLTMSIRAENAPQYIYVKVKPDDLAGSMKAVTAVWKGVNPSAKADPTFLEENTNRQYRNEEMMTTIFTSGAILTILISCMGLFAIALFIMEQRTKEIGIRKVLGASVPGIVQLLSKEFARMVAVAFLLAAPLSWWLMNLWLQNFAYRIHPQWWMLLTGGAIVMAVAMLTVGVQAVRAALANPVRSLKTE